jgi:hypothetical protein
MAKKTSSAAPPPSPYALLATRLQRSVNNPTAQQSRTALLERFDSDCAEAWEQIMEELGETENVTLAYRDDGHIQIFWTVVEDY